MPPCQPMQSSPTIPLSSGQQQAAGEELLTPQEVALLLKISVKTVYAHATGLGGFYPGGIRVLRFRREAINELVEGQAARGLALSVRGKQEVVCRRGIQDQVRSEGGTRRTKKRSQVNPSGKNRHNLGLNLDQGGLAGGSSRDLAHQVMVAAGSAGQDIIPDCQR